MYYIYHHIILLFFSTYETFDLTIVQILCKRNGHGHQLMVLNLDWGLLDRPRPALRATSSQSPAVQSIPDLLYHLFETLSKNLFTTIINLLPPKTQLWYGMYP